MNVKELKLTVDCLDATLTQLRSFLYHGDFEESLTLFMAQDSVTAALDLLAQIEANIRNNED